MLEIVVQGGERFDESNSEFIDLPDFVLRLEHSLVALSKWEQVYEKPFLTEDNKTDEEVLAYIRFMAIDGEIPPEVFQSLTAEDFKTINDYIGAKATATWFSDKKGPPSREIITSELIYYWMFANQIDKSCELWHLNRLLTLIKVFSAKAEAENKKPSKPTASDLEERRALNEKRKAQMGTSG